MARKLKQISPESSLSSPPEHLDKLMPENPPNTDLSVKTSVTRKRKAENTTTSTKRARKTTVKEEELDGSANDSSGADEKPIPKPKARSRKVKVEDETVAGATKDIKKPKRLRKKKDEDLAPLQERTMGSKLRVGAHVSMAGGKFGFVIIVS